jgi:hypothetical protein
MHPPSARIPRELVHESIIHQGIDFSIPHATPNVKSPKAF